MHSAHPRARLRGLRGVFLAPFQKVASREWLDLLGSLTSMLGSLESLG